MAYRGLQLFCLVILTYFSSSCGLGNCNVFENVIVNRGFLLGEYPSLRVQGGYAVSDDGGVAGLIVINTANGYLAFDRASTVEPHRRCAVEVQEGGLVAIDPCTQAKWILTNGSPAEIAECPLRPYRASRQGDVIYVVN